LTVKGTADLAGAKPIVTLRLKGEDVQVADVADARVWVSPTLDYAQDAQGLRLTGTVKVPKADITPRQLAANAVGATGDQVIVGAAAPVLDTLPLTAEVRVELGENVRFEGFGLKSRITGAVTAIDRPGSGGTRGRGELELVDAAYKAYGQEVQVTTGRILFVGGPIGEPQVDIVARRAPREDVTVSLRVRGTLDQPTFNLSSTPAMPREQQLGWLLFGRPIDAGDGQFSGAAAALSLGIAGGDALASRVGKVIGLDQVSLAADASSTAWQPSETMPGVPGTEQTRFTVGKWLSPKLFVSYGVGLFDNGNVLRLLYDLGRGFKLRTEAGVESSGDLLYTVEK
jgi:translocation and assembly module TamB